VVFEEAKLHQQYLIDTSVAVGIHTVEHAVDYMENMTHARAIAYQPVYSGAFGAGPGLNIALGFPAILRAYGKQCSFNDAKYPLYHARTDRVQWLEVVEQRFLQLEGVGLGRQKWAELRDQSKPFSRAFSDYWGVPEVLFTRSMRAP
jgi:hypothetical protein